MTVWRNGWPPNVRPARQGRRRQISGQSLMQYSAFFFGAADEVLSFCPDLSFLSVFPAFPDLSFDFSGLLDSSFFSSFLSSSFLSSSFLSDCSDLSLSGFSG